MAKDAKGHGSEKRGGSGVSAGDLKQFAQIAKVHPADRAASRLAAARSNPNHPLGALTRAVSGSGGPFIEASELAGGHPKSAPVSIHSHFRLVGSQYLPKR